MKNSGEKILPRAYPTDNLGEPVSPYELGYTQNPDTLTNNHHHAFYARRFGATAIGLAYRNLEALQSRLDVLEHIDLHRRYSGFTPPSEAVMLDRIEQEAEHDGQLKVWNMSTKRYDLKPITEQKINTLKDLYGRTARVH